MNKVLYLTLLLLVLANNQVIRVPTVTPTNPTVSLRTQPAFLYHGTVDIQMENYKFFQHSHSTQTQNKISNLFVPTN